jgi:hypothetical protein
MSEYHYLLVGGSRNGQRHVDKCHQFSLCFWEDASKHSEREFNGKQNERYKVNPEKGADGNWYLVGYCGNCSKIKADELTTQAQTKHVKPLM